MSTPYFKFKRFTIWHDKCAMKVGTDGVLLGAWVQINRIHKILDVGTGTGLIALMLAQRNLQAQITALEIDKVAISQAEENVVNSPWANRIKVVCADFRLFQTERKYDLIISNPPYFIDALNSPDKQRNMARHTCELNYEQFFCRSAQILQEQGSICIIIPAEIEKLIIDTAWKYKLFPLRCLHVFTKPGKLCKRVLLSFGFQECDCANEIMYIEKAHRQYTSEYIKLTQEFYMNM